MNDKLEVGLNIAIEWGSSACKAKIIGEMEDRYFVHMDWGGKALMDIAELMKRKFVVIPKQPSIFSQIKLFFGFENDK
jgi:hypothetical protein